MSATLPLTSVRDVPGWYGKLASLGDFAHRRLPPEYLRACDAWLSAAMRGGREALGSHWLEAYLNAPVLRFAWAPGVVGAQWWFGVLMPSCDSVGRYFPLLVAHARSDAPQDRIALDHLERWLDHLEQAAMQTLQESPTALEALEDALQEAPPWPTARNGDAGSLRGPAEGGRFRLASAVPLSRWVPALAAREFSTQLAGCTLWWRVSRDGADDAVEVVRGLPEGRAFAALWTGAGKR